MWTATATARQEEVKQKPEKRMVNYYISENTLNRFKQVCDKEARNYSKVIENFMIRYVNSRI